MVALTCHYPQLHIPKLPAGNYLALPYTSNILRQRKINRPAESILDSRGHLTKTYLQVRMHVGGRVGGERHLRQCPPYRLFSQNFIVSRQLLWEVFRRYDDDMDSSLNFVELAAVLRDGRNEAVSKEKYAEYTKQFDSNDGGLSRDGFVALVTEAKPPAIREMLT